MCNATNTERCDNINGLCYCKSGWEGVHCNADVQECAENKMICI